MFCLDGRMFRLDGGMFRVSLRNSPAALRRNGFGRY